MGTTQAVKSTVKKAARGSTAPESVPRAKAFHLPVIPVFRGMDTMAPSGKFWMAIPRASANAPARPPQQAFLQGQPYQQPMYQQMTPPAYSAQQSPYAPPQQAPGYQAQPAAANPYAPPMNAAQPLRSDSAGRNTSENVLRAIIPYSSRTTPSR